MYQKNLVGGPPLDTWLVHTEPFWDQEMKKWEKYLKILYSYEYSTGQDEVQIGTWNRRTWL